MGVVDGGRQIVITGVVTNAVVGPPCNMKVIDGWWQDMAGTDTLSFFDARGRTFSYKPSTDLVPIAFGKLDWLEGPITITTTGSSTQVAYFILGNK